MDERTLWWVILALIFLIVLGQRRRTRHIPARSKHLAWAKFYQEFYRDPANRGRKIRKKDFEFDHIIPFSKGGTNEPDNIRVLPKTENRRKGAKRPFP